MYGEERRIFGDAGYICIQKRPKHRDRKDVFLFSARRSGTRKGVDGDRRKAEKIKASIRSKLEHPFRYIKQVFRDSKVRYRRLAKNTYRLHLLAAFS